MTLKDVVEKEKYSKFKLESADYDESSDTTTLTFLYPYGDKPAEKEREELQQEVQGFLGEFAKCRIKFRQSYIDNQVLFNKLKDFAEKEFAFLKSFLQEKDLNLIQENDTVRVSIDCDRDMYDLLGTYDFSNRFSTFLNNSYYENIEVLLNPCKEVERQSIQEVISAENELSAILNQEAKLNIVEVDEVVNVVGKLLPSSAKFIKDIKIGMEEVILAGRVKNPIFSQFIPRSQKDRENPEYKVKWTFTLIDASGEIDVVMFPNEKDAELLQQIQEGNEVILSGVVSEFANTTNIKADALSLCEIVNGEVHYIWREPILDYQTIFPKPMVDLQQMSMFSIFDQKPKEYWRDNKSVVVFDLETTGLNFKVCDIIEIGAVKIVDGICVETFSTLINPQYSLPAEIVRITGITDEMLVFAPTLDKVLPDFHKFTQGSVLSAYNIGFDIKFLKKAGKKYRYNFNSEQIDTLELARKKIPSLHNYKLSSVVKALDIPLEEAHRALNDAIATAKVFIKLIE